ncbi:caspase family protein [uncultured Muribaculum sp.]|nr:caspase family protein [uncultured Muribaculum sp.]
MPMPAMTVPVMGLPGVTSESAEEAVEQATDLYKQFKWQKYDGETDEKIYPLAYKAYQASVKALDSTVPGSELCNRARGILADIMPDILRGASYYSGKDDSELKKFASAYVDAKLRPDFKDEKLIEPEGMYPVLVYISASGAFNGGDYAKALKYFDEYIKVGPAEQLASIYLFKLHSHANLKQFDEAVETAIEGLKRFPDDQNLMLAGVQASVNGHNPDHLQGLLDRLMILKPGDEQLLNIQGQLYESQGELQKALDTYQTLLEMRPDNLNIVRHVAIAYFNLGVDNYNQMIYETDEKNQRKFKRQSNEFFEAACNYLEPAVANDPFSLKYLKALGVSYGCLGRLDRFAEVNNRIKALGSNPVSEKDMPAMVSVDGSAFSASASGSSDKRINDAPRYSDFAKSYVEKRLADWAKKGEFERTEAFIDRVSGDGMEEREAALLKDAEKEYLTLYTRRLTLSDTRLLPYDTDTELYTLETSYGPVSIRVPLDNGEAEGFKSEWEMAKLREPTYSIDDNKVRLARLNVILPSGKSYIAENYDAASKTTTVDIEKPEITLSGSAVEGKNLAHVKSKRTYAPSDVDRDIPVNKTDAANTFAMIIANENYSKAVNVEAASHDGASFADYCNLTLGLPKSNIRIYNDASLAEMLRAMADMRNIASVTSGKADLIFYYAGHGVPDDATKDAYLLPTDGDAAVTETCLSLRNLYDNLAGLDTRRVLVFLDACFSGSTREGKMLNQARGVEIKPKAEVPKGNMFVLSAASDSETALPYKEKSHGLFTYFLLKKLQESKGKVSLGELSDYVIDNVSRQSVIVNSKKQTPTASASGHLSGKWRNEKLKD